MFAFVTVSHPDEIKDPKRQGKLRQHAIRNGLQKSKANRAKKNGIFVPVEMDGDMRQLEKRTPPQAGVSLTTAPSNSLLDPFDTLCGCPERLRTLMRHRRCLYLYRAWSTSLTHAASAKQAGEPIFCVEDSGKPFFQGMEAIFKGALTDPSLFHALSLVLSLAANNNLPNVEVLTHRGELLSGIRTNIEGLKGAPQVSTITAMLLLIGYEYRIDGANGKTIAAHISGVQTMMKICKARNVALIDEVQRALFWQDLLSCLMAGTPRFLSHKDFRDFSSAKNVDHNERWEVPSGFLSSISQWPQDFALVLQDLNSLCSRVDLQCGPSKQPLDVFPIDDDQANLESRLVDLLRECRRPAHVTDPWYEASILAAYICTYKLSTGIWMGCFIPEICITQMLRLILQIPRNPQWKPAPNLLLWLLFVSGGMTDRRDIRKPIVQLIHEIFVHPSVDPSQGWETLKPKLRSFIWCEHTMGQKIRNFYKEVYPDCEDVTQPEAGWTIPWVSDKLNDMQV
jgi:hypothetical protein